MLKHRERNTQCECRASKLPKLPLSDTSICALETGPLQLVMSSDTFWAVSYTHLRAHETSAHL
eukprot:2101908-Alexandrium_andersonii.AAC.1